MQGPRARSWLVAGAGLVLLSCAVHRRASSSGHQAVVGHALTKEEPRPDDVNVGLSGTQSAGFVVAALDAVDEARGACPAGMVSIEGSYCIDRYEASLLEMTDGGEERRFSPFSTVGDHPVRAVSLPGVYPQGYISARQAKRACSASGKRLCKLSEWQRACRGPEDKKYGYADERIPGRCNDDGKNPVVTLFGLRWDARTMNQPQLNQLEGTLSKTGEHEGCSNGYGVYDMVGNLHEWIADPNGTFYGGYYQDVSSFGHGDGCSYKTTAHAPGYHDYSTGFRCCADASAGSAPIASAATPRAAPRPGMKLGGGKLRK